MEEQRTRQNTTRRKQKFQSIAIVGEVKIDCVENPRANKIPANWVEWWINITNLEHYKPNSLLFNLMQPGVLSTIRFYISYFQSIRQSNSNWKPFNPSKIAGGDYYF